MDGGNTLKADTGARHHELKRALFSLAGNTEFFLGWGLPDDNLELDLSLGVQQFGTELRLGLLQERLLAPVSIAPALGIMYRPFMDPKSPWLTGGFDASKRFGVFAVFVDLYCSYGPEAQAIGSEINKWAFRHDEEYDPEFPFGGGFADSRMEARLTGAIGVVATARSNVKVRRCPAPPFKCHELERVVVEEENSADFIFSVAPYYVVWSDDSTVAECMECTHSGTVTMDQDFGVHLVMSFRGLL